MNDKLKLDHNWGDIFTYKECTVIRVYACPQPPHILPKYIPPRLAIVEFFWQLFMMNKEYLPANMHKGTFLCRCFKVGDFSIGKNAIDQIHDYLRHYNLATAPYRMYDPDNYIKGELKALRTTFYLPARSFHLRT